MHHRTHPDLPRFTNDDKKRVQREVCRNHAKIGETPNSLLSGSLNGWYFRVHVWYVCMFVWTIATLVVDSIPIDTFLVGWTSIYQLFWGSLGTRVLTHPHSIGFTMFHHYKIKGYNMCVCIHKKAKSACYVSNIHSPIHPYGIRYDPILMFWQEVRWSLIWQLGNLTPSPQHFQPLGVHHPAGGSGLVTGAPATAHLKTSLPCPSGSLKCEKRSHSQFAQGSQFPDKMYQ